MSKSEPCKLLSLHLNATPMWVYTHVGIYPVNNTAAIYVAQTIWRNMDICT